MSIIDLSFNNISIANYFSGDNSYIPVSELLYIHTHPLVRPNFLTDIEMLINQVAVKIAAKPVNGVPATDLANYAVSLAVELQNLTETNAPVVLGLLRVIYTYCNNLLTTIG
jgi:hypothetical protein